MLRVLQILVATALTAFLLLYVVDWREALAALARLNPVWAIGVIATVTADRALTAFKWTVLLRARGIRISLLKSMQIYCSAMVWGTAMPSTIGADAIRTTLTVREGAALTDTLATIVVERMFGFAASLLWGLGSLLVLHRLLPEAAFYDRALFVIALALLAAFLLIAFSARRGTFEWLTRWLPDKIRQHRLFARLGQLHGAYHELSATPRTVITFGSLTLLSQAFAIAITWVTARALGVHAQMPILLAAVPLAFLAARLPISLDGIGVFEGIFIAIMALAGVRPEEALAIALVGRILQIISWLPWWASYLLTSKSLRVPTRVGEA